MGQALERGKSSNSDLRMTTRIPTPRTDAAWKAVSSDPYIDEMFGMDVLAETMESMELEIIDLKARLEYFEKRAEKAEDELIEIKLFGKTQPHENL
jgi:hypothetical protein